MKIVVNQSEPFKVVKDTFSVAKTTNGYTLQWCNEKSENDADWQSYETPVPANEALVVNGLTPYVWVRLSGNTDEETIVIL